MKKTLTTVLIATMLTGRAVAEKLTYPIVDTAQLHCYDAFDVIKCPAPGEPFYGQDAHYITLPPVYQDNGDGTVSDLVTGLMWT